MILSVGIWEVKSPGYCKSTNTSETPSYFLEELLNALQLISGPSLYIIWKTHGRDSKENLHQGNVSLGLINTAQNWFSTHAPSHMGLSDFGSAMNNGNRLLGQDRIMGDSTAHFGAEARTLSIQMASHLVDRKKTKNNMRSLLDRDGKQVYISVYSIVHVMIHLLNCPCEFENKPVQQF